MIRVLDKREATVLSLVVGTRIHDDIDHIIGHFPHLFQDLFALLALRNAANEQAAVVHRATQADHAVLAYLVVVQLAHGSLSLVTGRVHDEAVAAVVAAVLHHQAEFVDGASTLQDRHELVFEAVAWDLAHEDLTGSVGFFVMPFRRWAVFALTVLLDDWVAGARLERFQSFMVADLLSVDDGRLVLLFFECLWLEGRGWSGCCELGWVVWDGDLRVG